MSLRPTATASRWAIFRPLYGVPPTARLRSQSQANCSPAAASVRGSLLPKGRHWLRRRFADGHGSRQHSRSSLPVQPSCSAPATPRPPKPPGSSAVLACPSSARDWAPRSARTPAGASGWLGYGRGTEPDPRRPRGARELHRDSARMVFAARRGRRRSLNSPQ